MRDATKSSKGIIFLFSGILTGALNYGLQVAAARQLSPTDFGVLNSWLANVSIFFAIGAILQYFSNFHPVSRTHLRYSTVTILSIYLGITFYWLMSEGSAQNVKAYFLIIAAGAYGWLIGQAQIRFKFGTISAVSLAGSIGKIAIILIPFTMIFGSAVGQFQFAFFAGGLPAMGILIFSLWNAEKPLLPSQKKIPWLAPIVLSLASAGIPQLDLIVLSHSISASAFSEFAKSSLFYKGIYFLVAILAQWTLPQQVHQSMIPEKSGWRIYAAICTLIVIAVTLVAEPLSKILFNWQVGPDLQVVFLSCVQMCLLSAIFLQIQKLCTQGQAPRALFVLLAICIPGLVQLLFTLPLATYFILGIFSQSCILIIEHYSTSKRISSQSSVQISGQNSVGPSGQK